MDARDVDFPEVVTSTYRSGSVIETVWGISANHGGGYSYRLCRLPANGKTDITEECFQKTPLRFEGTKQAIQFYNGTRVYFEGMKTSNGTYPPGSEWMRNPIPACKPHGEPSTSPGCPDGTQFEPPVPEAFGFGVYRLDNVAGKWYFEWSIVDRVVLPPGLEPGLYVLGFRWDTEGPTASSHSNPHATDATHTMLGGIPRVLQRKCILRAHEKNVMAFVCCL